MDRQPLRVLWIGLVAMASLLGPAGASPGDLAGLWRAKRTFDPGLHGTLTVERRHDGWCADLAGFSVVVALSDTFVLDFPDDRGALRAIYDPKEQSLEGFWVQPAPVQIGGRVASPVRFEKKGPGLWRGAVVPRASELTMYLRIDRREDGSLGAFLRNPDRNLGIFYNLDRIEADGDSLRFIGRFFRNTEERVLLEGTLRGDDTFSVYFPGRGRTYDFERIDDRPSSGFYARGQDPPPWVYVPPPALEDGWPTGTLDDVGLSLTPIKEMIETEIDPPARDVHAHDVHGLLIARSGTLVLEQYFHGFHREVPHDTRSASKSLASLLVGAAMASGIAVDPTTPVYATLGDPRGSRDPRRGRMTLEHLLTMSSGLYCDDRDPEAPGNEDVMQQQDEPDWYRYALGVPMAGEPGEDPVYCSANSNLIGAVLAAASGEPLELLIDRLIARPLGIDRYYLFLQPTGEPYLGGGAHWLPRDFMKLGQVMLNGGTWQGRRVVSEGWVARSTSPLRNLRDLGYGYQWWVTDYPYRDGTVQAFFAGGNGGQVIMGIPALDLLVAFYGGNYSDSVLYKAQKVLVPKYILPAVERRPSF
jgi:CubicO group peptidase (beta-lactamase class C family)